MTGQIFGADIDFNAGKDSRIVQNLGKGSAVLLLLADCFVVEDRTTDALAEPRCGHEQFPIGASSLFGLGNPSCGESLVASGIALIHCEQAFIVGDQRPSVSISACAFI